MFKNYLCYFEKSKLFNLKNSYYYIGILYLFIFSILLIKTDYMPYVFDNNETFSSISHAKNMNLFGIKSTFGLTDESFSNKAKSHPFVYTHQGNFPRLFSYLLIKLGIDSVRWHIVITTFTIGFLGILLCHYFLSTNISILFSSIFCTLLMTDYIMFMQWQVNTWRVWQLFFFFSSLICSQGLMRKSVTIYIPLCLINFCCLTYTEISFALFVTINCIIFSFFQNKEIKKNILNIFILGLGCSLGMAILIIQNIAFLGVDTFLKDLNYAFFSRNNFLKNQNLEISQFYKTNKIAFWENFNSDPHIRHPFYMVLRFYHYCLLPYSPFLNFFVFTAFILTFIKTHFKKYIFKTLKAIVSPFFSILSLVLASKIIYTCINLNGISNSLNFKNIFDTMSYVKLELLVLIPLFLTYILKPLDKFLSRFLKPSISMSLLIINIIAILIALIISIFDDYSMPLAKNITDLINNEFFIPFSPIALYVVFLIYSSIKFKNKENSKANTFDSISHYIFAGLIAFFVTFFVLPGYIYTGYLVRYCCFSVYVHTALFAWFIYENMNNILCYNFENKQSKIQQLYVPVALIIIFSFSWTILQFNYIKEFKPNHFKFISLLKYPPLLNKNLAANNYAAPFAYMTQSWGYLDPEISMSKIIKMNKKESFKLKQDFRYLWFNDAQQNNEYTNPDLFICWIQYYSLDQFKGDKPRCGQTKLVKLARSTKGEKFHIREYAKDQSGEDKWSIVLLH